MKKVAKKDEGKAVTEIVVNEMLCNCVKHLTALCEPNIELLRLVDGDLPCTAKVYPIDSFKESSTMEDTSKVQSRKLIEECWEILHTDLHSAGFVFDPEYRLFMQHQNEERMSGFHA